MQRIVLVSALTCLVSAPSLRAGTGNSLLDVSRDGKRLLVANPDSGTVTVIDTDKRTVVREIPVGAKPEGITWLGNGPRAAVTLYAGNAVVFFDAATGQ